MPALPKPIPKIDYPAHLDLMWSKHKKARQPNAPTVVSLFSGCGGSSLGYSMAGYCERLAVEWNDPAVAVFKENFPDVPVWHGDIKKLSVNECMDLARLSGPGELDLLDGSPPCQGFSLSGNRNISDSRNYLFKEYLRLLSGLKPKAIVIENVPGLVFGKMRIVFAEIMRELRNCGYIAAARVVNAMYFHVPQSRRRLFIIGADASKYDSISHMQAESQPISVLDGLKGVEDDGFPLSPILSNIASSLKFGEGGEAVAGRSHWFNTKRLNPMLPCSPLLAGGGSCEVLHWSEQRKLGSCECAAIASFPREFKWLGQPRTPLKLMGNCVPPLMAEAIGRHVRRTLLDGREGVGGI